MRVHTIRCLTFTLLQELIGYEDTTGTMFGGGRTEAAPPDMGLGRVVVHPGDHRARAVLSTARASTTRSRRRTARSSPVARRATASLSRSTQRKARRGTSAARRSMTRPTWVTAGRMSSSTSSAGWRCEATQAAAARRPVRSS